MKRRFLFLSLSIVLLAQSICAADSSVDTQKFWPQWRGPLLNGVAPLADPPLQWSETKNVKWKVKIPGFGSSTPIIWGNRVFILTAIPTGKKAGTGKLAEKAEKPLSENEKPSSGDRPGRRGGGGGGNNFGAEPAPDELFQFAVLCLDRETGKTVWQNTAREEIPHEGHHRDHGFASASPVTDGKMLIAYFGSRGIYGYDLEGNRKWEQDFGDMQTRNGFGEGTSPALHGNTVLALWDHEGEDDFLVALDKNTGKELWRAKREEATGWSTPLVVERNGKAEVVINGTAKTRSYDLTNGKQIWEGPGTTVNAIPTPVADGDAVYVTGGFRGSALHAIKLGRTGELIGTDAVLWSHGKSTPYVPTPLLTDGLLYFVASNNGMLSCFDAKTGKSHYDAERLESLRGIYASPVAAKDRVYVLGREGVCLVLKKIPKLEILATNTLADKTDASIAIVGKELFIRGHENLYCIAEK